MAFKIYTKTGDKGETSLLGGTRVSKNHIRIEAYGTLDELNSWLGFIKDSLDQNVETQKKELEHIQNYIFLLGSYLATSPDKEIKMSLPDINPSEINDLELSIDIMEKQLPELKNFIIPGGNIHASKIHIARCVCRRGERICVAIDHHDPIQNHIIQYLNRLSDYLFVLGRFTLHTYKGEESTWQTR